MITKIIGFQLDLSSFSSVKQIVQLNDGYVIFGQEDFEQKLKSVTMQLNSQKLLYFKIQEGKCISEKPYQIGEGLVVLSNIGTIQNQITALISRQGNRSLVQFNPIEHTNVYLIPSIPYKQHQIDCESDYMIYCFPDRVTLIGLYQTANGVLIECTNHPSGIHILKKFKQAEKVVSFRIYNTNAIVFLEGEEMHMFDGQDEIFSMNIQVPSLFKIKFMIEINDQYVLIVKDRLDKFYKFLNKGCEVEYFHTLKCQELIKGTINVETQRKQSINLTKIKDYYHIWISTIYHCNDGEQILFVNTFKITDDCEAIFVQGFKLWKSKQITFVQKDEFVHEYLLFRDEQTIKAIYVSL